MSDRAETAQLTAERRQRFMQAADAPLAVRRAVLLLAGHASGHLRVPHGDSCEECREEWPCVAVRRAAGAALDAVADLPSQRDVGVEWARVRRASLDIAVHIEAGFSSEWWRGYGAALDDVIRLAGQPNSQPERLRNPDEGSGS